MINKKRKGEQLIFRQSSDNKRWVIYSPQRSKRYGRMSNNICPFCPGNEHLTPPALQDWPVRVFSNLFPILPNHKVIVHSPDHKRDIPNLAVEQIIYIIKTYIACYQNLQNFGKVIIFNNSIARAGATIVHPHSQIIALAKNIKVYIPPLEHVANIVSSTNYFSVYCPEFSQFPCETWIAPKKPLSFYALSNTIQNDLAQILKNILSKIRSLNSPDQTAYNYYFSPSLKNWYIRIIPRLTIGGGFEFATNLTVNSIPPSKAIKILSRI